MKELRQVYCHTDKGLAWAYKDDDNEDYKPNTIYKVDGYEMVDTVLDANFYKWATPMSL
jgi:hypothetical protein